MKILITSGGTKVAIDKVRFITNMSRGTFGSEICRQLLLNNNEVDFLMAKDSRTPFKFEINCGESNVIESYKKLTNWIEFIRDYNKNYQEYTYKTFDEYSSTVIHLIQRIKYDMIILACACSDYGVCDFVNGKIRSGNSMKIELYPLQKIISHVRQFQPDTFLVGFKLLVGSSDPELETAAFESLEKNKCDAVIANDLEHIQKSNHTLLVISKLETQRMEKNNCEKSGTTLAKHLVNYLEQLYNMKKKGVKL